MTHQGGAWHGKRITELKNREEAWTTLHPKVREAFRECAYDYAINRAVQQTKLGYSPETIVSQIKLYDAYAVAKNTLEFYGHTHPQADFVTITLWEQRANKKPRKPTQAELDALLASI